jgi:RNA polymerase sigma-70 factor (ECF subfamily)
MGSEAAIERLFRKEHARVVASLTRRFGDLELAEEAVQEAYLRALATWDKSPPPNPVGWIMTTARNKAIDRLRRESARDHKQLAASLFTTDEEEPADWLADDRLRLMFTCCHPALSLPARLALTLRMVAGLKTEEIARAFLVSEATMSQRLLRAKQKIKAARIPFRLPEPPELKGRLEGVLGVIYLLFNEGYSATRGQLLRSELCEEAIRLSRLVAELVPEEEEAGGLLCLLLFSHARARARCDETGALVRLADQDRHLWDRGMTNEARFLLRSLLEKNRPGRYQLLAAINAVHSEAASIEETDWSQIRQLYELLKSYDSSPVVELNLAIAVAETSGPLVALEALEGLDLEEYYLWHATRAELFGRLGRLEEAENAYESALCLTENEAERAFLLSRRDELGANR